MSAWMRLHANALADAVGRLVRQPLASGVAIVVLAIAIALPVIAGVALRSLGAAAAGLDAEPHVNVYLGLAATDEDVRRVQAALRGHPAAAGVRSLMST